jgi:hypothetical protein
VVPNENAQRCAANGAEIQARSSARPRQRKFGFVTPSAQAEGLPESSRGSSAAKRSDTPGPMIQKSPADPGGVAEFWHPFRMHRSYRLPTGGLRSAATPGYSLPTLRVENACYAARHLPNENAHWFAANGAKIHIRWHRRVNCSERSASRRLRKLKACQSIDGGRATRLAVAERRRERHSRSNDS